MRRQEIKNMLTGSYLTYSYLYNQKTHFQTLKKKLRQFKSSDILLHLARINTLFFYYANFKSEREYWELQNILKENFISKEIQRDIVRKPMAKDMFVFTRQQILFLMRLSILNCSDDALLLAEGGTDGGFELGVCSLIANDYLITKKEEKATELGSNSKREKHLGLQLSPLFEFYNPLDFQRGLVRSEIIFSEILKSDEYKEILNKNKKLKNFDVSQEFKSHRNWNSKSCFRALQKLSVALAFLRR